MNVVAARRLATVAQIIKSADESISVDGEANNIACAPFSNGPSPLKDVAPFGKNQTSKTSSNHLYGPATVVAG